MDPDLTRRFGRPGLASAVRFFLAVRAGRTQDVARLLDDEPELVQAREEWSKHEALRDGLPYAGHATGLARAAAQGDAAMVALLLARASDTEAKCGCAAAEKALFNAVGAGDASTIRLLLDAGADPNGVAGAGSSPLHVAAFTGDAAAAAQLLAAGARIDARDSGGRTPAQCARERGNRALAASLGEQGSCPESNGAAHDLLLGRVLSPDGSPADGAPDVAWRSERARPVPAPVPGPRETGIGAIDLLAPLPRDGVVEVRGSAALGTMVALGELSERLARRDAGITVWCAFEQRGDEGAALLAGLRELGVLGHGVVVLARRRDGPESHGRAVHTASAIVERFVAGGRSAQLALLADETRDEIVAGAIDKRPVAATLLVARIRLADPAANLDPLAAPYDARILFDPMLAERHFYPAIDPVRSVSTVRIDRRHREIANAVRAELSALRNEEGSASPLALRVEAMLAQPFHVASPFTGHPGADRTLDALLEEIREVLARA